MDAATKKRARPADPTVSDKVEQYLFSLRSAWIDAPTERASWYAPGGKILLDCKILPPDGTLPAGFSRSAPGRYQYNLGRWKDADRYRPVAFRVPFLGQETFDDKECTVSHLCHNPVCCNPAHHTLESLAFNKARNGCPGSAACRHVPRCLIPGPFCGPG